MAETQEGVKRSVDIGPVDTAASVTSSGKVRVRHLYTIEQLETMLRIAREKHVNIPSTDATSNETSAQNATPRRVFVKEGTPAWSAWVAYKRLENPVWDLAKPHVIDGKHYTGWWFPSLFPPAVGTDDASTAR